MGTELDSTSWASLAASFGQQVTQKWLQFGKRYYGDWLGLAARSPMTQWLMAESIKRSYDVTNECFIAPAEPSSGLGFAIDRDAQSAGPRYVPLPHPDWTPEDVAKVKLVGSGSECAGAPDCQTNDLMPENFMVRVEGRLLSVTLVSLGHPARAIVQTTVQASGGRPVEYHLHFEAVDATIPVTVSAS